MAHSRANADATLRAYLIEQRSEFRNLMARTLLEDGPESAEYAFTECSKSVDPLIAGKACLVSRYELPDDHPLSAPVAGHPCDDLELGADDVLRDAPRTAAAPRVPPYRRTQDLDV